MQRLSIVDLGSNTARLVVFEYEPGAWYWLRDSIREPIRLGEGIATSGSISPEAVERAGAALHLFADFAEASGLEPPHVVCTSAVREAANGQDVLDEILRLGLPFEVLPGEEESRLGVLAVANSFALEDAWVVDLGGGSAQIGEMRGREARRGSSHPLGAVRLTDSFLTSDPPAPSETRALEEFVDTTLDDWLGSMRDDPAPIVAMGGSIRNLARAVQVELDYPLDLIHGYVLERDPYESLVEELLTLTIEERARRFDINPDRADILAGAAIVFRHLLRRSDREVLHISGHGVREGVFFRRFLPAPHKISDVTRFGVRNLATHYGQTEPHVARVRRIAHRLFRILEPLHGLGERERVLLDAAATLHDIGMTVGYHRHHKHGAYLAVNRPLPGFDHREQALIALMIRYHRKGRPGLSPYGAIMHEDDRTTLRQLTACLRLAEQLERSRAGRIENISGTIGSDEVVLTAQAREQAVVEIWEARKHEDLFESAFGLGLRIESRVGVEPS